MLSAELRARIMRECSYREANRGDVVWRSGDEPNGLYCLLSGCVRAETSQSKHGPAMLTIFHAGSWIGEAEILAGTGRITTMTALRDWSSAFLSRRAIMSLARDYPELWRGLGYLAADHLYLAVAGINDLMIRSSSDRLAGVLLRICGARVPAFATAINSDLDVTQSELAELCNLSRSTVAGLLEDFERRALVQMHYGRLKLLDVSALAETIGLAPGEHGI